MSNITESTLELIGGTPLLKLNRYARMQMLQTQQSFKIEYLNHRIGKRQSCIIYD